MRNPSSASLLFTTSHLVARHEVRGLANERGKIKLTVDQRKLFLSANKKVLIVGKQLALLGDVQFPSEPLGLARTLYNRVDDHLRYDKSQLVYGRGDGAIGMRHPFRQSHRGPSHVHQRPRY